MVHNFKKSRQGCSVEPRSWIYTPISTILCKLKVRKKPYLYRVIILSGGRLVEASVTANDMMLRRIPVKGIAVLRAHKGYTIKFY